MIRDVRPGESGLGISYERWAAVPDGRHEIVATPEGFGFEHVS
jgi:hypothetical protein